MNMMKIVWRMGLGLVVVSAVLQGCGQQPGDKELSKARTSLRNQEWVQARDHLRRAIDYRPGSSANAQAKTLLGVANARLQDFDAAEEDFEESLALNPNQAAAHANLGFLHYRKGQYKEAVEAFMSALEHEPELVRARAGLGIVQLQQGQAKLALKNLYSALDLRSDDPQILNAIGLAELKTRDTKTGPASALRRFRQALDADPDFGPALYNAAYMEQKYFRKYPEAATYLKRYLKQSGEQDRQEEASRLLSTAMAKIAAQEAVARKKKPVVSPSSKTVAVARTTEPRPATPPPKPPSAESAAVEKSIDPLEQARAAASDGKIEEALAICLNLAGVAEGEKDQSKQERALKTAVILCSKHPRAHFSLARYWLDNGKAAMSLRSFKQAVALDPDWVPALMGLAAAALQEKEYDAAVISLEKAVKYQPDDPDALWALGVMYERQLEMPEKAQVVYKKFAKQFPKDERAAQAVSWIAERLANAAKNSSADQGRTRGGAPASSTTRRKKKPFSLAGQRAPQSSDPAETLDINPGMTRDTRAAVEAYNRGTLYQARRDWEKAAEYYKLAAEKDATFAHAFYNLGTVYREKGNLSLAGDAYRYAIEAQPDMVNARYNLALVLKEKGQAREAIGELHQVLKMQPQHPFSHYVLGLLYANDIGDIGRAKEHYKKFLSLKPDYRSAAAIRQWLAVN